MQERRAEKKLIELAGEARAKGYTIMTPKLFVDKCYGKKLAYYNQAENKIVIDEHYIENANKDEIYGTIIHELAHAIAEQNNKEKKAVWHGQVWKDINTKLGGDAERFHKEVIKSPNTKRNLWKNYMLSNLNMKQQGGRKGRISNGSKEGIML